MAKYAFINYFTNIIHVIKYLAKLNFAKINTNKTGNW